MSCWSAKKGYTFIWKHHFLPHPSGCTCSFCWFQWHFRKILVCFFFSEYTSKMNTNFSLPTRINCWCIQRNLYHRQRGIFLSLLLATLGWSWLQELWSAETRVSCVNCTKKNQVSKVYSVSCLSEFILIGANKGAVYTRSSSHSKKKTSNPATKSDGQQFLVEEEC